MGAKVIYVLAIPFFFQTLFLTIKSLVPDATGLVQKLSALLLLLGSLFLYFAEDIGLGFIVDYTILLPLVLEIVFCSIVSIEKKHSTGSLGELSALLVFLTLSNISILLKLSILVFAFLLDAYRCSQMTMSREKKLVFYTSLLCALLASALFFNFENTVVFRTIVTLLIPISFLIFPFSLASGGDRVYPYRLGQRLLTLLLFTEFGRSILSIGSLQSVLPILLIILGIGLFHRKMGSVLLAGQSGLELVLLIVISNLLGLESSMLLVSYAWACFFLRIPDFIVTVPLKFFNDLKSKCLFGLFILGLLPGPFSTILEVLNERARLEGTYVLYLTLAVFYLLLAAIFVFRLTDYSARRSVGRSFSPFNQIVLLSSIIIGVILTI